MSDININVNIENANINITAENVVTNNIPELWYEHQVTFANGVASIANLQSPNYFAIEWTFLNNGNEWRNNLASMEFPWMTPDLEVYVQPNAQGNTPYETQWPEWASDGHEIRVWNRKPGNLNSTFLIRIKKSAYQGAGV